MKVGLHHSQHQPRCCSHLGRAREHDAAEDPGLVRLEVLEGRAKGAPNRTELRIVTMTIVPPFVHALDILLLPNSSPWCSLRRGLNYDGVRGHRLGRSGLVDWSL